MCQEGPAAPVNYTLVMESISRLPEIYFIRNHSRGRNRGDRNYSSRLGWGEESSSEEPLTNSSLDKLSTVSPKTNLKLCTDEY